MNDGTPLVSIICLAYNHEKYIRQCLDGFVMQKTGFRYEIIIHDDASKDGTTAIIREYAKKYPGLFVTIFQEENQYSKGIPIGKTYMYPLAKGKYIAECEGDDYWTDPYKLQKQVDFMESHPEYVLCCTDAVQLDDNTGELVQMTQDVKEEITPEYLLEENRITTLTSLYRTSILKDYLEEFTPGMPRFQLGDYPQWLYFASRGKIRKLPFYSAVYRYRTGSVSHSEDLSRTIRFIMSAYDVRAYCNMRLGFNVKGIRIKEFVCIRKTCKELYRKRKDSYWPLVLRFWTVLAWEYLFKKDFIR